MPSDAFMEFCKWVEGQKPSVFGRLWVRKLPETGSGTIHSEWVSWEATEAVRCSNCGEVGEWQRWVTKKNGSFKWPSCPACRRRDPLSVAAYQEEFEGWVQEYEEVGAHCLHCGGHFSHEELRAHGRIGCPKPGCDGGAFDLSVDPWE